MIYFATDLANYSFVFSLSGFVAAAVFGFLNSRNRFEKGKQNETIDNLSKSNSAFETRHKADEITIEGREKEISLLKDNITTLKTKASALEDNITQAPSIMKLIEQNGNQHSEIMAALAKMTAEIGNLARAVVKKESNNG